MQGFQEVLLHGFAYRDPLEKARCQAQTLDTKPLSPCESVMDLADIKFIAIDLRDLPYLLPLFECCAGLKQRNLWGAGTVKMTKEQPTASRSERRHQHHVSKHAFREQPALPYM